MIILHYTWTEKLRGGGNNFTACSPQILSSCECFKHFSMTFFVINTDLVSTDHVITFALVQNHLPPKGREPYSEASVWITDLKESFIDL